MDITLGNVHTTSRLPGPAINPVVENSEEPQPSLSDLHDFEPKLEFDDTELLSPPPLQKDVMVDDFVLAEDEDIEPAEIVNPLEDDFDQLREEQSEAIVSVKNRCDFLGTDKQGRHIFAIYASRFPEKSQMEKFICDVIKEIEPFVENDYILVYFHQGLREHSKPSAQLLWNSYKELDRNFRKNLKNLYVVHPTLFIRFIWKFFSPFISGKFRQKLVYISSLDELRQALGLSKIKVPDSVCDFDEQLFRSKGTSSSFVYGYGGGNNNIAKQMANTVQFGAPLKFIVSNSPCLNSIPPIVRKCVDSLSITGMIDTEGIFRRSGNHSEIIALKERVNRGEDVDLSNVNVHVIAGLLKSFLRDLSEPLLTFELYDDITSFLDWQKEERSRNVTQLIREKLPEENYELFKYLVEFLVRVMECEDLNKMTSSNLAIVFGPNFLWSNRNNTTLEDIRPINAFIDFVLQNHKDIYLIDVNQRHTPIG
ncbi:rho GTPase-activating protein 68F isoform X1 [Bactrocera oleae]|uniref:rho GTPase-activating protein 68F isoform X1 n=1 Tax=Bactrocera oleae TaxID=104688 RepID=UPI001748B81A|nr:rho GTPase-activating protein 68F isoform X1 [Bactrocera oleae]XP_036220556.1 rho GTPase-activating protein 68F isoform X1 [Bactrocera oleae]XP_036220562.1 rho GTPase-activating protein 68F isoform X1 [Bactrocera oleae]XP_036220564.1 rho GTPase-activating protein 68F isoform X1 [Bactrocera oleae]